jgi:hypothetical protein
MWPAIAGVLFVLVLILMYYVWASQQTVAQPATVVYEDDWATGGWTGGWWPWIPKRYPHHDHRPVPHHPPRHWLGPGGTEWPRPPRLGPGGMARSHGIGSPRPSGGHH